MVTLDALEPFKIAHDIRRVPSYLVDEGDATYDISVSMKVIPGESLEREMGITRSCLRNSYWTFRQMVCVVFIASAAGYYNPIWNHCSSPFTLSQDAACVLGI